MQTLIRIVITSVVALFIFIAGAGIGYAFHEFGVDDQPTLEESEAFGLYWEVWHRVQEQFYGEVPAEPATTYGAIRGALETVEPGVQARITFHRAHQCARVCRGYGQITICSTLGSDVYTLTQNLVEQRIQDRSKTAHVRMLHAQARKALPAHCRFSPQEEGPESRLLS